VLVAIVVATVGDIVGDIVGAGLDRPIGIAHAGIVWRFPNVVGGIGEPRSFGPEVAIWTFRSRALPRSF
jgi:hypothetical protein